MVVFVTNSRKKREKFGWLGFQIWLDLWSLVRISGIWGLDIERGGRDKEMVKKWVDWRWSTTGGRFPAATGSGGERNWERGEREKRVS